MTQPDFQHLLDSINALSAEQVRQLRRELDGKSTPPATLDRQKIDGQQTDPDVQRRLFDAGLLSEIKPPITDLTPYRDRKAISIDGEPMSETVIRERR